MSRSSRAIAVVAAAFLAHPGAAHAEDRLSLGVRGLSYRSAGGELRLDLGGRIQLDSISYFQASNDQHFLDFRQARVQLSGFVGEGLEFRVEHEFAGSAGWRNLWAGYAPQTGLGARAGNFIVPFSLEELQGYSTNPFMERSLANALSPGMGLGANASLRRGPWLATVGWFGDPIRNEDGRVRQRGDGVVARVSFLPASGPDGFVHLGAAVERRNLDPGESLLIQTGPEAAFAPILISTRDMARVERFANLGLEAAWSRGPVLVQAQAIQTFAGHASGPDQHFRGGYVLGAWVLTGQGYDYNRTAGAVRGVAVRPGRQALELAARFSALDLDTGGVARDLTLGMNWYLSRNYRIMGNYVRSQTRRLPGAPGFDARVLAVRLQSSF